MTARSVRIRTAIATLVETRMFDLELESVHDKRLVFKPQCPLINPLCPEDLCWLPRDHVGTKEGYHVLGTTPYDYAEKFPKEWLRTDLDTPDQLIEAGIRLARQMGFSL